MNLMPQIQASSGIDLSLRISQRVRHSDYKGQRVTGVVRALSVDPDQGLMVTIALDSPIVIPASDGHREVHIHNQHAPAHEFAPFDERDDLIDELVTVMRMARDTLATAVRHAWQGSTDADVAEHVVIKHMDATLAKATGSRA